MKSILITGGAGFIGSNFVHYTMNNGDYDKVIVLDKLTYAGNKASLSDLEEDSRFIFAQGDICDGRFVSELIRAFNPVHVVNFAAETHVDRSIDSPRQFIETNIVGVFELLEACRSNLNRSPNPDFRFLHVSTDEVYGELDDDSPGFSETTPYDPSSPYSASKAAADHLVAAYCRTFGFPGLITNCSNNYGPYQFPEKLIPLMILNALELEKLPVYGTGKNVRDWLYVDDHCDAIFTVLNKGKVGETYNIGGECEQTNLEVVKTICSVLDDLIKPAYQEKTSYKELITFVEDRPGHDHRYAIDMTKIKEELGWSPKHNFEEGLRSTIQWYLDNEQWRKTVQRGSRRERLGKN